MIVASLAFMNGCSARVALGSLGVFLPQKLLSSAVASEVCESVEPIMPNLYGFTPSFCSSCSPVCSAVRAYSPCSISFFFSSLRLRLPLSQILEVREFVVLVKGRDAFRRRP